MIAGGRSVDLRQRTFRSPVIDEYVELVAELEALTERIDPSWLVKLADRFRIETTRDLAAVESLQTIAALFTRAEVWNRPFDPGALLDAVETAALAPQPTMVTPEVWLGDVMRLRGRSFAHLFAVRMQEDVLPQRRVEDPLLVDADRRILGVREIGNGRAEELLLFRLIEGAASSSLTYSLAASDGFGKPLRRSQFVRKIAGVSVSSGAREKERGGASLNRLRPLQLLVRSGTRGVFDGYLRSDLVQQRATAALQSISPTQLEDFGECPQKFLLKHLLGVRDLDDPEMEMQINHREKGIVDHRILERFYRDAGPSTLLETMGALPMIPRLVIESLERIVDDEFDKLEEKIPPFNPPMRSIERQSTKRLLRQFVAADLADLDALSLMPEQFEHKFGPFIFEVDGTPLRVEGKIDRIDEGRGNVPHRRLQIGQGPASPEARRQDRSRCAPAARALRDGRGEFLRLRREQDLRSDQADCRSVQKPATSRSISAKRSSDCVRRSISSSPPCCGARFRRSPMTGTTTTTPASTVR